MIEFFHEGGAAMWLILISGAILAGLELRNGGAGSSCLPSVTLLSLGLAGSALGFYVSLGAVIEGKVAHDLLLTGAKDSLAPLILGSFLAVFLRYWLRSLGVPAVCAFAPLRGATRPP